VLHILNGDSVANTLREAEARGRGVPGTCAVWADVLHEGPVPPDDDLERWFRIRSRFFATAGWASEPDALRHLHRWQQGLDAWPEHDEVVVWLEHDLFDQLLLLRHVAWWQRLDPAGRRLSLVCIGAYPGIEPFHGLGQLDAEQLPSLLPARELVDDEQKRLAERVWRAFTSADPMAVQRLVDDGCLPFPFLADALRRFLQEFPSAREGLGRTERQIVEALVGGPRTPADLFQANAEREERVFMGDATFWLRLAAMASPPQPLVVLDAPGPPGPPGHWRLPDGAVRLTGTARRILAGRVDAVRLRGVDRWFGGAHVSGAAAPWRWDEGAGRLVSRA
jgi:hypothetical protein